MRPGIPQGFIIFGSIGHKVLATAIRYETFTFGTIYQDLTDEGESEDIYWGLSVAIQRLVKFGFLYFAGKEPRDFGRSSQRYSLYPNKRSHKRQRSLTHAERQENYRIRKRIKVPSVFAFRGQIALNGEQSATL